MGKKDSVAIKLADGSISAKSYGSIQLTVRAHKTAPVKITFFVLAGPNNLLGRYALEQLWPVEYKAVRDIAVNSGSALNDVAVNSGSALRDVAVNSGSARCMRRICGGKKQSVWRREADNMLSEPAGVPKEQKTALEKQSALSSFVAVVPKIRKLPLTPYGKTSREPLDNSAGRWLLEKQ